MINKETIQALTEEWLQGNDYFLVDINFGTDDRIVIEIDHADGVWIEDCAELSRFLQMNWVTSSWRSAAQVSDSRSRWSSST